MTPVAFGVIFALTGSVGPIIGQNYGARRMDRVQRTLTNSFLLSIGYVLVAWAALALAAPFIVQAFDANGDSADYVDVLLPGKASSRGSSWRASSSPTPPSTISAIPCSAMVFAWGRATLGTMPFVTLGVRWGGIQGGLHGSRSARRSSASSRSRPPM